MAQAAAYNKRIEWEPPKPLCLFRELARRLCSLLATLIIHIWIILNAKFMRYLHKKMWTINVGAVEVMLR